MQYAIGYAIVDHITPAQPRYTRGGRRFATLAEAVRQARIDQGTCRTVWMQHGAVHVETEKVVWWPTSAVLVGARAICSPGRVLH